jgi:hypothetical protein
VYSRLDRQIPDAGHENARKQPKRRLGVYCRYGAAVDLPRNRHENRCPQKKITGSSFKNAKILKEIGAMTAPDGPSPARLINRR